ncbi:uncharacterized protein EAF02_000061 [Botrytis sinoallii]|uniref:uncharacterized protein n=1 Tax=Botrytis sinoallii TaxID=1463999 RepID=UPI001900AF5F|nr:uncharacterized protein EAF02_000061 [Botrytis sinoallii]KAF7892523.1 hypothetical protein EAF02_000061 [Botrytis sinoallii]
MYRLAINSAMRPAVRTSIPAARAFTVSVRTMGEGDTGAARLAANIPQRKGDAFTKREKANEDFTIRQRENEKLLELRKKITEQRDHLKKLEDHITEIEKQSGGEQK